MLGDMYTLGGSYIGFGEPIADSLLHAYFFYGHQSATERFDLV